MRYICRINKSVRGLEGETLKCNWPIKDLIGDPWGGGNLQKDNELSIIWCVLVEFWGFLVEKNFFF